MSVLYKILQEDFKPKIISFPIVKEHDKGWVVDHTDYPPYTPFKYVRKEPKQKYAYPTELEAIEAMIEEKQKKIKTLSKQIAKAEKFMFDLNVMKHASQEEERGVSETQGKNNKK